MIKIFWSFKCALNNFLISSILQMQLEAHLKLHNEKWSNNESKKCKLCNKKFTQPFLYRRHLREHYKVRTNFSNNRKIFFHMIVNRRLTLFAFLNFYSHFWPYIFDRHKLKVLSRQKEAAYTKILTNARFVWRFLKNRVNWHDICQCTLVKNRSRCVTFSLE